MKHGDDKFIDKLLKDDGGSKKHKASAGDDKALDDLLAVEKPKAGPAKGKKKGDDVDSLLSSADKAPPMPETHVKHETPGVGQAGDSRRRRWRRPRRWFARSRRRMTASST